MIVVEEEKDLVKVSVYAEFTLADYREVEVLEQSGGVKTLEHAALDKITREVERRPARPAVGVQPPQ